MAHRAVVFAIARLSCLSVNCSVDLTLPACYVTKITICLYTVHVKH